jgi:putative tricarboxylic transport membrane protein
MATLIALPAPASEPSFDALKIIAPASAGGGWDQTARAMAEVLRTAGIARSVEVTNSPGAGGAIGLAQFVTGQKGEGGALLVGGLFMMEAIRTNGATVSVLQTNPIARVTGEYEVIAVPADSELHTLDDLVQALRSDPGAVSWAGGSAGGGDQLLLSLVARAIGVEPVQIHYVPFSGGGEVAAALIDREVSAGVSGYGELEPEIRSGRLRALAVSAERREPGIAVPTLTERGIDVTFVNWRGVFAPPGISDAQRRQLIAAVDAMVRHPAWKAMLRQHHWLDLYLPGDAFVSFVQSEQARAAAGPDPRGITHASHATPVWARGTRAFRARPVLSASLLGAALLLIAFLAWRWVRSLERERVLAHDLDAAREDARRRSAQADDLLKGLGEQIDRQFESWRLTSAEREVAALMLKGLRHKEIASVRGTSERTVRQQALTIYKKAGLDGRTDLAAYFLEDLLQPQKPPRARPA